MNDEAVLAAPVVDYLNDLHWEVYQEVKVNGCSSIADIVAVQGKRIWIIEVKTSFSLALIAQAMAWEGYAHWVSVAVPKPKRPSYKTLECGRKILKHYGIGMLMVDTKGVVDTWGLTGPVKPSLNRHAPRIQTILNGLCDEQKTYAKAGNNRGEFYSPFKRTCDNIVRIVKSNPGINLKSLIETVDHHYASVASARSSIRYWADTGKIKGIKMERNGRFINFYPDEAQ